MERLFFHLSSAMGIKLRAPTDASVGARSLDLPMYWLFLTEDKLR